MSKEESYLEELTRVAQMYLDDPERMSRELKDRNAMAEKLNKRVLNIIKTSPMYGKIDENGHSYDFDVTTKEILEQLKQENEDALLKAFPDLSIIINMDM